MKKILFSIIIPLYNAESYIYKNITSILNQSYDKFELIIVNDGSTDASLNIIKSFDDSRIKIYSKLNDGTANARNYGLKHVNGDYIFFVDADDYIEADTLSSYIEIIEKFNPDLIVNGFYSETYASNSSYKIYSNDKFYKNKKEIKNNLVNLYKDNLLYNVWNKLYKRSIINDNNLKFKDINFGEDMIFVQNYLIHCNNIYNSSNCFYHYVREIKNSITTSFVPNFFNIRLNENKLLCNFFGNYGIKKDEYVDFISKRFIERTLGCLENLHRSNYLSFKEKYIETSNIIQHKETKYYLSIYKTNNKLIKFIILSYKNNNVLFAYFYGFLFHFFKTISPSFFYIFKNKR